MFYKKAVLKNFSIPTRIHLCWSLFLIKLQAATFLKRDSNTLVFCYYSEIVKNNYFEVCERLLLNDVLSQIFDPFI